MASPQKAKGGAFEREVAKKLSVRYGETFIRTPGSGAFIGGTNSARKDYLTEENIRTFKGDITPPRSFNRLNSECKSYTNFSFPKLFTENKQLDLWIEQTLEPADEGDVNIVFFKITRQGTFVCIQDNELLDKSHALKYRDWYVFDFDKFFEINHENFAEMCSP